MRQLIRTLLLGILLGLPCTAQAEEDHIISRALLRDAAGDLSIEQVSASDFSPTGTILAAGYTNAAHWLRLEVRPRADGGPLVLRIRPPYLDEITLFEPLATTPGIWQARITGDRTPWIGRESTGTLLGFTIHPSTATTYYLRLKTTSNSLLNVVALTPQEALIGSIRLGFWQWLYLSVMMSILLWALHDFLHGRQAVVGWFILLQAVQVPYSLAIMGLLAPLLPTAGSLDSLTSALVCGITLCSLLFHRQFLALFQPLQLLLRGLDLLIVATLMALLLLLAGQARSALQLNALAGLLAAPLFLGLALTARIDALPGRRLLHMFYAIMTLSLLITFAPLLGLAKATAWNLHSTLIHGLIAAALMAVLLYLRSRQLQRQGRQALIELTLAQQQLQIERTQLAEQHRFMAMLTHEIKTPLATVRLTLDTLSIAGPRLQRMDRALQDMDRIIDRCRQTDQLEQDGLSQQVQSCRLDAVLQETAAASSAPGRIQLTLAPALPPLTTDPHLLAIALGNLFDNALKYAAPDTPVNVSAECVIAHGRPGLRITVANLPGPVGLPEADKVFVKYYRSPAAHARSGSGLGLYLVKGIANKLGGTITYEGTAGQVCFSLWLLQ